MFPHITFTVPTPSSEQKQLYQMRLPGDPKRNLPEVTTIPAIQGGSRAHTIFDPVRSETSSPAQDPEGYTILKGLL